MTLGLPGVDYGRSDGQARSHLGSPLSVAELLLHDFAAALCVPDPELSSAKSVGSRGNRVKSLGPVG